MLYNGIRIPATWPPRDGDSTLRIAPEVPYLANRPDVVPIDLGRQMFFDDFLIEQTNLSRRFHQPVKYEGNPILKPETSLEQNQGFNATTVPFSDGCFYDQADRLFKLWYMAGWCDGTALATSRDGLHWQRPLLDVVSGTNLVVAPRDNLRRDGVSVWLDHEAKDPGQRYKMFLYARTGEIGTRLATGSGYLLTSPDGVHWTWQGRTGPTRDNTTFFYNPFRKTWVFSHRTRSADKAQYRTRGYWENQDFLAALDEWDGYAPVFWLGADEQDLPEPSIGDPPQLYKIDATPYESVMLGLVEILYGPQNGKCAKGGFPKLTELQVAFSRDGFHWDRPSRAPFIAASKKKGDWERGYITSVGGVCLIVHDKLYFYYGAFAGNETNTNPVELWSGMYANASTGVAMLRRDGFASMDADKDGGMLTTRPVTFTGRHLFVNVACPGGSLQVEILDREGHVMKPFALEKSRPVSVDSTIHRISWEGDPDLARLAGQPVRFRFHLRNGSLYSFWVSPQENGASGGYVAAGGPGFTGATDTVGTAGYSEK